MKKFNRGDPVIIEGTYRGIYAGTWVDLYISEKDRELLFGDYEHDPNDLFCYPHVVVSERTCNLDNIGPGSLDNKNLHEYLSDDEIEHA